MMAVSSSATLNLTEVSLSITPPIWCAASPSLPAEITVVTLSTVDIVSIYFSRRLLPSCAPSFVLRLILITIGIFNSFDLSIRNFIPFITWVLNEKSPLPDLTIIIELSGATP